MTNENNQQQDATKAAQNQDTPETGKQAFSIPSWVYASLAAGVIGASLGDYWDYFLTPSAEAQIQAQIEDCVSTHAQTLIKPYSGELNAEVMGYSDIQTLTSPPDSGYHLIDFNVRVLLEPKTTESSGVKPHAMQKDLPVKGFKCFYDQAKFDAWQQSASEAG